MRYNAEIINFELLYIYDDKEPLLEDLYVLNYKRIMQEIVKASKRRNIDAVIGLVIVDGFLYKNIEPFYTMLEKIQLECRSLGIKKLALVAGMCDQFHENLKSRNLDYEIILWDYNINMVWQAYRDNLDDIHQWNTRRDKFLFLGGVPSRPNRLLLCNKFYEKDLLRHSEWSFFRPWTEPDKEWCRNALSHYSDNEYEEFLSYANRKVDNYYDEAKDFSRLLGKQLADAGLHNTTFCKNAGFIDTNVFGNTVLSVISEGYPTDDTLDSRFITEKTYRAIINKHPLIISGTPDMIDFMKSKGVKTFEEYVLHKEYYWEPDEDKRLSLIVENTEYFLKNFKKHEDAIRADIEHNYELFFKIVEENYKTLEKIQLEYTISDRSIRKWFEQKGFAHWLIILDQPKGPSL
jgi:hypothetical protein